LLILKNVKNVKNVNTHSTMLGPKMSVPIFRAPAAMAKLLHPSGENGIARGCKKAGIPQCVSTGASFPIAEIFEYVKGKGAIWGGRRRRRGRAADFLPAVC
jgi:L-lactate dehydrogenase (cytochrome)